VGPRAERAGPASTNQSHVAAMMATRCASSRSSYGAEPRGGSSAGHRRRRRLPRIPAPTRLTDPRLPAVEEMRHVGPASLAHRHYGHGRANRPWRAGHGKRGGPGPARGCVVLAPQRLPSEARGTGVADASFRLVKRAACEVTCPSGRRTPRTEGSPRPGNEWMSGRAA